MQYYTYTKKVIYNCVRVAKMGECDQKVQTSS